MGKRVRAAAVLVCGAMACGCGGMRGGRAPETPADSTLGCPKGEIEYEYHGAVYGRYAIARGCGRVDALNNDDGGGWSSLRQRAAFDLRCDAQSFDVAVLSETTFGVTGCGRRATYVWVDRTGFVANSIEQPTNAPNEPTFK